MIGLSLVMLDAAYEQIRELAASPLEHAAVLIVGRADHGALRLLVREVHMVPHAAMEVQTPTELLIHSEGYMHALRRAYDLGAAAIFVHTHPAGSPTASDQDAVVDRLLEPVFVGRTGREPYGSVVVTVANGTLQFTGHVRSRRNWRRIDRIWAIGDRLRLVSAADSPQPAPSPELFDRQVRAFGPAFQELLSQLTIGIVGAGGTGSPVAEQLVRMGVGRLLLFDDDTITATNLTRIHEVVRRDVGKRKVDALARRLRAIGTGTRIVPIVGRITTLAVAEQLRESDVIFGCTDDERGRAVLSRFAYRYLTPVFDSAFQIESDDGEVRDLIGRVTTMTPGHPCLYCRGRIDPERMRVEALPAQEHRAQTAEGYAPELGDPDPAVITFTTLVASLAVSELIERIVGYDQPPSTELLVLMHDRRISPSRDSVEGAHFCVRPDAWGQGDNDQEPFLGTTWAD